MTALRIENVSKRYPNGDGLGETSLDIAPGELFVLLGPSGSGKSTLLRAIGGFEAVTTGRIWTGDSDITDLAPESRPTSMVFQNHALWPHLTVAENIGLGLKAQRRPKPEIARTVTQVLEMVRLTGLDERRPPHLSGGQRQRVALARSLALEPKILLLDEPLSSLDARLRAELRVELRDLIKRLGLTAIYVTHDQEDALELADRIGVLRDGNLVQVGTSEDVFERPTDSFVARFCGDAVLLPCEAGPEANTVRLADGNIVRTAGGDPQGGFVAVRAEAIKVAPVDTAGTGPTVGTAKVLDRRYNGGRHRLLIDFEGVTFGVDVSDPTVSAGDPCTLHIPENRLWQVPK